MSNAYGGTAANPLDDLTADSPPELDAIEAAAAVEARVDDENSYGHIGRPFDRRSPFWIGMASTFGVSTAVIAVWSIYAARQILLLVVASLFVAAGLDPLVDWLRRRGLPRRVAVLIVILGALGAFAGILELVIPVVVNQVTQLINSLPTYSKQLNNRSSFLGRLNTRYHVETSLRSYLSGGSGTVASGVLGVGKAVLSALASTVIVIVVSIYLLVDMPRLKRALFSLSPRSRRARVVLIGEEIFVKVGGYVLGNAFISIITGVGTWLWCLALGIPYPLLLATIVAIFDLIPLVGSTIAGIIVAAVGLTVSIPVAGFTIGFYIVYRLVEDYLISPRIMRRTVSVPGLLTVIATLVGGTLLGIIGALIAIPVAAAIRLLLDQLAAPRLEHS
jgi:predicted PurR-regulated permease PerM